MRIKSLQIHGFKTFVDKTAFSFERGITGIVGPNGCGKSNVVDAIRWAMGEQSPRHLRGKGMQDVIFAGSDARAPVGLSEVVLTFDNADGIAPPEFASYSEIQVSRRLYRSGESEYAINRTPVRLRDVLDFFRDTGIGTKGYTIVEQGRIAEIVSAKAEERRVLIEEAAGISKYKARRREAERKLEGTEQNLTRVRDVLGEIRRQISSLERQAKKAAAYKRLRELQRVVELSLASEERQQLASEIEQARAHATQVHDRVAGVEANLAERENEVAERRLALAVCERDLAQGSEALFQIRARIKEIEGQIAYDRRERASLGEANEGRAREREQLAAQRLAAEQELARLRDELAAVEAALAEEEASTHAAEAASRAANDALRALEREREQHSAQLVELLTRIARAEDRLGALADRRAEIEQRLRSADEQLEVQQSEASSTDQEQRSLEEGLRNLLAERDRMMGLLRDALARQELSVAEARRASEDVRARRELFSVRRARLASLREILERREDLSGGVRHLMAQSPAERARFGLRGLVRDAFDVPADLERAVEAVLADRAEGVVLSSGGDADAALEALRRAEAGRGVLVVDREPSDAASGFVPLGEPLLARVGLRPGFEAVGRALLGGANVVDTLAQALGHYGQGRIPCSFVTRTGDVLSSDGVIRGGGAVRQAGILTRVREVRELEAEVAALEAEVASLTLVDERAQGDAQRGASELDNLRSRHHTAALAVANHEKDLERTRERLKAIGSAQESRGEERGGLIAELERIDLESIRHESYLVEGREQRGARQREQDTLGLRIGSAGRELTRLEAVATERRVERQGRRDARERIAGAVLRAGAQVEEARAWIQRRDAEIATGERRREELAGAIAAGEAAMNSELEGEENARAANERRREAYETVAARVRALEDAARDARLELETLRDAANEAELGLRERELRLTHVDSSARDRWNVELAHWKVPVLVDLGPELEPEIAGSAQADDEGVAEGGEPTAPESEEALLVRSASSAEREARREARELAELLALEAAERRGRLDEIRNKIEAIGDVNLGAIEEHEELRERFRFLTEQKNDLEHSVLQLRDAIARINRTSRARFQETFDAVNEKFKLNFPRLFRGGRAHLALTESEDLLEAGIDITAQPPGKRPQSVDLLSGGEKTMTAIALLVSVFQVKPSPFFLLDEVDAALDDANVGRFNEIVAEMSASSQFLLITHNKRTIQIADRLYGVTMEEKGVSKLVAVELH
ncbi:MAG TPA: chromosome segregation protein SMC [Myxococcota bacterium]